MIHTALEKDAAFTTLAILCRRICVLRARGRSVEANQLQSSEFARTVIDLKAQHGADALPEEKIRAIFTREQERVADAEVLAELLAHWMPQVSASVPIATGNAAVTASQSSRSQDGDRLVSQSTAPPPPSAVSGSAQANTAKPASSPPAIADMLDDMLNQDAARAKRHRNR